MSFAQRLGSAFDATLGIFSPENAIRRKLFRELLDKQKSSGRKRSAKYAAAKTTRMTGAWSPADVSVNTVIGNSLPEVRRRIRQLVRDFPYFARAVEILVDYTVGAGIVFQSRVRTAEGKLDKKRIQQIEDAMNYWFDEADASGKLHYYEMMQLAKRQDLEAGEFLIVKTLLKDSSRYIPYALQIYEADWLTDYHVSPKGKNKIQQGIEYDANTGHVVAYHFTDPDGWGKSKRISAKNIIHGLKTLRPGQLRGISPFTPGVMIAKDLQDVMDAEIDASKMAAKYLALVKTADPQFRQAAIGAAVDTDTDQKIEELENGIIEYLRPGEDVVLTHNPRPGTNFPPFVRLVLTMFAITAGAPYELISGDYRGLNYSTGKMIRNDFTHSLRPLSIRHIRQYCDPTIKPAIEYAVMAGKLDLPGYFRNPTPYLRREWQPPGMESVDPLRESKSRIDEMRAMTRSPQEIVRARGRDLEEVMKEIKAFLEMAEDMDLGHLVEAIFSGKISTASANNPAAVENNQKSSLAGPNARDFDDQLIEIIDRLDELVSADT